MIVTFRYGREASARRFQLNVTLLQVDLLRTVTLPHLQLFGISEGLELRVSARRPFYRCGYD